MKCTDPDGADRLVGRDPKRVLLYATHPVLTYRSFHAIAKWTYTEGNGLLQRAHYRSPEEIGAPFQRRPENRGESGSDVETPAAPVE